MVKSVGNRQDPFSATVPLPRKDKPPRPPRRPRPTPMAAMLVDLREFLTLYAAIGPTNWTYARWPHRIVSASTVEKRFGSWRQAAAQARRVTPS